MRTNRSRIFVALLAVMALALAACGGGGSDDSKSSGDNNEKSSTDSAKGPSGTGTAQVDALFYTKNASGEPEGGSSPVTVKIGPSSDKSIRVGFSEDEVAGTGDQWRASGWSAVTVATLLTGAPLRDRDVQFDLTGRIDGPSAGGLLTVATLSVLRGQPLQPDITMTGTINPDGTIGPVGGIPYKIDGVVKAGKKRMLIPAGQRNSADDSGALVDVVEAGRKKGITVTEVEDIYDAYKAFTGQDLPKAAAAGDVRLDEAAYQKLKAKVTTWLAKFDTSAGQFGAVSATAQEALNDLANLADEAQAQAVKLRDNGLEAGALNKAVQAAGLANATAKIGQQLDTLLVNGDITGFVSQVKASQAISGQIQGAVDSLKTFQPKTVSDAGALIESYGMIIDAISASSYGEDLLNSVTGLDEASVTAAVLGAVFYELAGTEVEASRDIIDVGRDLGGPPIAKDLDLKTTADFFRKGADANLTSFEEVIIEPAATAANISTDSAKVRFASNELDYALAVSGREVMAGLKQYFGDEEPSAYADLGGASMLYNRSAGLLAKYYSLGELDSELNVTGIKNDRAFGAAIDLAKSQVEGAVGVLQGKGVVPTLAAADYEVAGVERDGTASEKLSALSSYWAGYLNARMLAYLGGFAQV